MVEQSYLEALKKYDSFDRTTILQEMQKQEPQITEAAFKARLQRLLKENRIVRAGRNVYYIPHSPLRSYQCRYSDTAELVAQTITAQTHDLPFTIFEMVQLNEFVNHQIAHNTIFVSVEAELLDFVFGILGPPLLGQVLLAPTKKIYHTYRYDDTIIIGRLISEAPLGKPIFWHMRLEKLLVDCMADPLLRDSISESEIPGLYQNAFNSYAVDESCLFRYAKRRGIGEELRTLIKNETNITLRTEK